MARIVRNDPYLTREDTGADEGRTPAVQHYEKQAGSDGATSNTVFTLSKPYVTGSNTMLVFVNGSKAELKAGASAADEYEETNSSTVTFGASLGASDVVEFIVVGTYFIQDTDIYVTKALEKNSNIIINGDIGIAQRYTSKAGAASTAGNWVADRFEYLEACDVVATISQADDTPTFAESGYLGKYSAKVDVTTADASIAAGEYSVVQYQFEGFNIRPYFGRPLTLSFWFKSTKTGTQCVAFKAPNQPAGYAFEFTIAASDTWQLVTHTFTIPSTYTGVLYDNNPQMRIYWPLAAGSTYHIASTETWLDSTAATWFSTSNQINHCDSTANNFQITNVKLELGSVATPFVPRPIAEELALCQRYYEKSYDYDVAPGTANDVGCVGVNGVSGEGGIAGPRFQVPKRATGATMVIYDESGTAARVTNVTEAVSETVSSITDIGEKGVRVIATSTSFIDARMHYHFTADAEL